MKTLHNQTILYDEDCPLCQAYTSAFVKTGMLDKNGRKPYDQINEKEISFIDINRAANEIALIDYKNKTAVYGIESLLKIIGNSFPIIEKAGKLKLINYLLRKLYSFISYNRKVIVPNLKNADTKLKCEPSFNLKYRIIYIIFSIWITSIVLYKCSAMLPYIPKSNYTRELLMASGQIVFQYCFLLNKNREIIINYLGNLMTVSLYGCLLLIPMIIIEQISFINPSVALIWLSATILLIFLEHIRRVRILQLPKHLSFTWIIYRIIVLLLILKFPL